MISMFVGRIVKFGEVDCKWKYYKITRLAMFCKSINKNIKAFPVIIGRGRTRNADLSNLLNNIPEEGQVWLF